MVYTKVQTRIEALNGLSFESADDYDRLTKALSDRSSRVRWAVLQIIEDNKITVLADRVKLALTEKNWGLRTTAATCLGSILEPNGRPQAELRKLLKDAEWVVRIDAMESLQSLEDIGALPLMAKLLNDSNAVVRSYCASILVEMSGSAYKSQLLKRLKVESDDTALVGLRAALFSIGEQYLLPEILNLLTCERYQVRCAVTHSFENLPLNPDQRTQVINALVKLRRHEPTRAVTSTITSTLKIIRAHKETR